MTLVLHNADLLHCRLRTVQTGREVPHLVLVIVVNLHGVSVSEYCQAINEVLKVDLISRKLVLKAVNLGVENLIWRLLGCSHDIMNVCVEVRLALHVLRGLGHLELLARSVIGIAW